MGYLNTRRGELLGCGVVFDGIPSSIKHILETEMLGRLLRDITVQGFNFELNHLHKAFESRGWRYDNGWGYNQKSWSAYRKSDENPGNFTVILHGSLDFSDESWPVIAVRYYMQNGEHKTAEIWSGKTKCEEDVERLIGEIGC